MATDHQEKKSKKHKLFPNAPEFDYEEAAKVFAATVIFPISKLLILCSLIVYFHAEKFKAEWPNDLHENESGMFVLFIIFLVLFIAMLGVMKFIAFHTLHDDNAIFFIISIYISIIGFFGMSYFFLQILSIFFEPEFIEFNKLAFHGMHVPTEDKVVNWLDFFLFNG